MANATSSTVKPICSKCIMNILIVWAMCLLQAVIQQPSNIIRNRIYIAVNIIYLDYIVLHICGAYVCDIFAFCAMKSELGGFEWAANMLLLIWWWLLLGFMRTN